VPELPIIAYNIPSRVVVNVPPEQLAEIAKIENVVAVKQANNDDLQPIEGLDILAGNDDIFLKTLEIGGAGGICVASHLVGPQMREVWDAAQAGDLDRAREIDSGLREVGSEDLHKYGFLPEFVGRFPVVVTLDELCAQAGMAPLPYLEPMPDELDASLDEHSPEPADGPA